jgi:hypothetical protein
VHSHVGVSYRQEPKSLHGLESNLKCYEFVAGSLEPEANQLKYRLAQRVDDMRNSDDEFTARQSAKIE